MTHIGWDKNIDSASLTADNPAATKLSVNNLKSPDVAEPFRSSNTSIGIVADFGQSIDLNATMLAGLNTTAIEYRIRLSDTDSTGKSGEIFDSTLTVATGKEFDKVHGLFVYLFDQTYTGQYLRIDINDTAGNINNLEAGRWWAGKAFIPNKSFRYGWSLGVRDNSQQRQSPGGQIKVNKRPQQQTIEVNFASLNEGEVNEFVDTLLTEVGLYSDLLIVPDGVQDRRAYESIWGYLEDLRNRSHRTLRKYSFRMTVVERK